MNRADIRSLLKEVLGPNTLLLDHPKWVGLKCPFAPWLHAKGTDRKPSAGVSVHDDSPSVFNCLTCSRKYRLSSFLREYGQYSGEDYSGMLGELEKEEFFGGNLKPWGQKPGGTDPLPEPLDQATYLDLYDPAYDHWYLNDRYLDPDKYLDNQAIDAETAKLIDIRVDPDNHGVERLLFPVFDHRGGFYGYTGRAIEDVMPKVRDYYGLPKQHLLLGSHLLPQDAKYIIAVEGLFDFARLYQYGYPAVAYMSSGLTDRQIEVLIDIGLPVYFFRDNDLAGRTAEANLSRSKLCNHVPVMKVRYPARAREGAKHPNEKLWVPHDPDQLTADEVGTMVQDARLL